MSTDHSITETSLNWPALAAKLVDLMSLQDGEKVLLVGVPGRFDPLVEELANLLTAKEVTYLGALSVNQNQPEPWSTEYVIACRQKTGVELSSHLKELDLGVMLPGASAGDISYRIIQEQLEEGRKRTIHFHWSGAYDHNGHLLEMDAQKDQVYQKAVLETDYADLAGRQQMFEQSMRNNIIRVSTPGGTDLHFQIGNRPVTKQNGNASAANALNARNLIDREIEVPAGAIRVAPLEETVNGTIVFPDGLWDNQPVKGLKMVFENGKLVSLQAESGQNYVENELSRAGGDSGRSFREFALGMNPLLKIPSEQETWIPYYGYGSGVVRLSLGDNTELGGKVSGGYVRWNFFTDATVSIGDTIWVADGTLIK